jgi:hypothetical protein
MDTSLVGRPPRQPLSSSLESHLCASAVPTQMWRFIDGLASAHPPIPTPVRHALKDVASVPHRDRRPNAKQGFREFQAARRTIQGYEALNIIRKGQVRWLSGSGVRCQNRFINELFEVAV